jgi:AAA domain
MPLKVATGYSDLKMDGPLLQEIAQRIRESEIDVFMFDPLVTLHGTNETDNNKMAEIFSVLTSIADTCHCAGDISHHVRKLQFGATDYTSHDARGASSIRDATRAMRVLNQMSTSDARQLGFKDLERLSYVRVDIGKGNTTAPATTAVWRKFVSVDLPNGDNVGVLTEWAPPAEGEAPTGRQQEEQQRDEEIFLTILWRLRGEGTNVVRVGSHSYAPTVFADEPEAEVICPGSRRAHSTTRKVAMKRAMDRLSKARRIHVEPYTNSAGRTAKRLAPGAPPSRLHTEVEADEALTPEDPPE